MPEALRKLEEKINYSFKNQFIFKKSLTHRSYRAEHNLKYDNQRLEFLGDAVIEIILTEYLFVRYQNDDEGKLTKMRSSFAQQGMLANFAKKIQLGKFVFLGKGEIESGGCDRSSTLCDAFEALMGAVYLDGGLEAARQVLVPLVEECGADPDELVIDLNPKGMLQEFTQKHYGNAPVYKLESVDGPDHSPQYMVSVMVNDEKLADGKGGKRKSAESAAAKIALKILMKRGDIKEVDLEPEAKPMETPAPSTPPAEPTPASAPAKKTASKKKASVSAELKN